MKLSLTRTSVAIAVAGFGASLAIAQSGANAVDGRWDAALVRPNGDTIPFRLDISGSGTATKGTLYNGFQPFDSHNGGIVSGQSSLP